jgi:hypothetical protein
VIGIWPRHLLMDGTTTKVQRVIDSMGARITALLPFLTPEQVRLYQPLTLPIGLQFGGYLLLAFGFAPASVAGQPRRRKGNRKRKSRKALAPKTAPTANVVAFQPSSKQSQRSSLGRATGPGRLEKIVLGVYLDRS